jgi:hypothetical protein
MLVWVPEELLEFAIYDGMRGVSLRSPRRGRLSEEERRHLAEAVMKRIRLCQWRVVRRDVPTHSTFGPPLSK